MSSIIQDQSGRYLYLQSGAGWICLDCTSAPLGAGALGTVYLGHDCLTGEPVAVKVIDPGLSEIPQVRRRARAEAGLTFLHPNIVRMLGMCEYEDGHGPIFIMSSYVRGVTFDAYCGSLASLGNKYRILDILQKSSVILRALGYLHGIGLVHRDVKPSNIMISEDGVPKLMDLGISGFETEGMAREYGFSGTALYAAPELVSQSIATPGTDIYAMGVTVFEAITGYNPFYSDEMDEVLHNQLYNPLPSDRFIPKKLFGILQKATAKSPEDRYWSAVAFADDMDMFLTTYV